MIRISLAGSRRRSDLLGGDGLAAWREWSDLTRLFTMEAAGSSETSTKRALAKIKTSHEKT